MIYLPPSLPPPSLPHLSLSPSPLSPSPLSPSPPSSSEGQFDTFLYQRGEETVVGSVKKCWCSCFSERVMSHRLECGMPTNRVKMAVVVQVC